MQKRLRNSGTARMPSDAASASRQFEEGGTVTKIPLSQASNVTSHCSVQCAQCSIVCVCVCVCVCFSYLLRVVLCFVCVCAAWHHCLSFSLCAGRSLLSTPAPCAGYYNNTLPAVLTCVGMRTVLMVTPCLGAQAAASITAFCEATEDKMIPSKWGTYTRTK